MSKYADQRIRVKFTGGREVTGVLKGYDQLLNLVLDDVKEDVAGLIHPSLLALVLMDRADPEPRTRSLGLAVLRGPTITLLSPVDGFEEIANPFMAAE